MRTLFVLLRLLSDKLRLTGLRKTGSDREENRGRGEWHMGRVIGSALRKEVRM